jgi:hypothetical protein
MVIGATSEITVSNEASGAELFVNPLSGGLVSGARNQLISVRAEIGGEVNWPRPS